MKVAFLASDKEREQDLAAAFCAGVRAHGGEAETIDLTGAPVDLAEFDAAAMVGVKSFEYWEGARMAGCVPIMLDKGYVRDRVRGAKTWRYWRVAVGDHHPKLQARPPERFAALGLTAQPWRKTGKHIILAGSSAKYHAFYGLPDPTTYAREVVARLREVTNRPIVYRPKPSWRDAVPIKGCRYSTNTEHISAVLRGAWALVTHGSNASFEAALAGVPSIVLGNGIAKPLSSTDLGEIEAPRLGNRARWFASLAYCQWTLEEFESGEAWAEIKGQV